MSDDFADAKQKLTDLVAEIDSSVSLVIPARPTLDAFRISLTKGSNRRFISLTEDDMLDLVENEAAAATTREMLTTEIAALS